MRLFPSIVGISQFNKSVSCFPSAGKLWWESHDPPIKSNSIVAQFVALDQKSYRPNFHGINKSCMGQDNCVPENSSIRNIVSVSHSNKILLGVPKRVQHYTALQSKCQPISAGCWTWSNKPRDRYSFPLLRNVNRFSIFKTETHGWTEQTNMMAHHRQMAGLVPIINGTSLKYWNKQLFFKFLSRKLDPVLIT
jgi:hypothetical protein